MSVELLVIKNICSQILFTPIYDVDIYVHICTYICMNKIYDMQRSIQSRTYILWDLKLELL